MAKSNVQDNLKALKQDHRKIKPLFFNKHPSGKNIKNRINHGNIIISCYPHLPMKRFLASFVAIAIAMMNIPMLHHADGCLDGTLCDPMHSFAHADSHAHNNDKTDHDTDSETAECECCATGHHHSHASIFASKSEATISIARALPASTSGHYFSQFTHPPSKPPKA